MYSIIETFLSTSLLFYPSLFLIPYKIERKKKIILFLVSYCILYFGYYGIKISSWTNFIAVPAFCIFVAVITKKYLISLILISFGYSLLLITNNITVGILLKLGSKFLESIYTTLIFEISFVLAHMIITFWIGKMIKSNISFWENLIYLSKTKKILISIFLGILFIIFQFLIAYEAVSGRDHEVIMSNTIIISIIFIAICTIVLYLSKKILIYERRVDAIAKKINKLNNNQIETIVELIENSGESDDNKKILKDLIRINKK